VTKGLAGIKFSVSPSAYGYRRAIVIRIHKMRVNPKRSLNEKYGWKGILSMFEFSPTGLLEPVWWRNSRWIIVRPAIIKGMRK